MISLQTVLVFTFKGLKIENVYIPDSRPIATCGLISQNAMLLFFTRIINYAMHLGKRRWKIRYRVMVAHNKNDILPKKQMQ